LWSIVRLFAPSVTRDAHPAVAVDRRVVDPDRVVEAERAARLVGAREVDAVAADVADRDVGDLGVADAAEPDAVVVLVGQVPQPGEGLAPTIVRLRSVTAVLP
jgi:hypothetical protein